MSKECFIPGTLVYFADDCNSKGMPNSVALVLDTNGQQDTSTWAPAAVKKYQELVEKVRRGKQIIIKICRRFDDSGFSPADLGWPSLFSLNGKIRLLQGLPLLLLLQRDEEDLRFEKTQPASWPEH